MKISDYIVQFLIEHQITDVFGYPGGMVTHLMESFRKQEDKISAHVNYHEQAAAFAACGYAQITAKPGVAYATSGPGATNLLTGVCNAYFDSIPTLFITGQVNTFEAKGNLAVRQKGFQETDIISMVRGVTKYCEYISKPDDIRYCLEKAFYIATEGRPGPVLLDIPMDIQRSEIDLNELRKFKVPEKGQVSLNKECSYVMEQLRRVKRPVLLLGNGVKQSNSVAYAVEFAEKTGIPVVTSMPAFDILPRNIRNNYGFIGAYGGRVGNFILAKSDLVIALGTRLDVRQIGARKEGFAPNAELIRIDIDSGEFSNYIKQEEKRYQCDIISFFEELNDLLDEFKISAEWITVCDEIRNSLDGLDEKYPNRLMRCLSHCIPEQCIITTDVGQNQVWTAQSFDVKLAQKILFSAGHGAMGYSLPAAIGAYYASRKPVISINGDGGIQMNIKELQFIAREQLPIVVVIFNNKALGMIRHFQEMYFDSNFAQTVPEGGYSVPDFSMIARAYGIEYACIREEKDITEALFAKNRPLVIEILIEEPTYVTPKLEFGKPNQDQEPLIERSLYQRLMAL